MKDDIVIAINNILTLKKGTKYASLQEIYDEVSKIRNVERDEALETQIRARLQEHSSQYKNFNGKEDLFETQSFNSGLWRNKITGEKEIREYVFELIKQFPGIDVTNLQKSILRIINDKLTVADKLESKTRPGEMKIEQIIRNFVSHKESYKDKIDFVVDGNITRLYLKEENDIKSDDTELEVEEIKEKQIADILLEESEKPEVKEAPGTLKLSTEIPQPKKKRSNSNRVFIRKSDFESYVSDYKKKLDNGYLGEALVYEYEREKLIDLGRSDLADKIRWISRDDGDGYGYDIQSFDIVDGKEKEIYIEVKSTSSSLTSDFEMTSKELDFARFHKDNYKIYRIYKNGNKTSGYIIDNTLDEDFDVTPSVYKISIKKAEE